MYVHLYKHEFVVYVNVILHVINIHCFGTFIIYNIYTCSNINIRTHVFENFKWMKTRGCAKKPVVQRVVSFYFYTIVSSCQIYTYHIYIYKILYICITIYIYVYIYLDIHINITNYKQ